MALTLAASYNDDYGRVQITISGAATDADYAKVEFSLDQITWSTIRGGDVVGLVAGAGHVDHYDGYKFGVPNYYRVTAIDSALIQPVASGVIATANNATVTPAIPAGVAAGNMMVLFATHRNTAASITTPTGWTRVTGGASNVATFWRVYQAGDTNPSVAFTGGSAGDSCSAIIRVWSNAQEPTHVALQLNAVAAQDVATPGGSQPTLSNLVWLMHEWKQSTGTGAGLPTLQFEADPVGGFNTAGANAESNVIWRTKAETNVQTILAATTSWTGGTTAISRARLMYMQARAFTDQAITSTTPVLPNANVKPYWLINPGRPGQNVRVECTDISEITNAGRTGVFEILGRSVPVVVSDVMASDEITISIDAASKQEVNDLAGRLALGDPMYFLVADPAADVDSFYFTVTDMKRRRDAANSSWTLDITVRETGQPAPTVYGLTYIWNDVISDYATWTDVVAGNVSWSNLVDKISNDIIVVP